MLMASCKKEEQTDVFERPTTLNFSNTSTGLSPIIQKMRDGDSVTVVCYGNSITFGGVRIPYPLALQQKWRSRYNNPGITVHNEGHPGWTAEMANGAMDSLILPYQPDMVTIIFGINDMWSGRTLENFTENMLDMVVRLKQQGITVVVMSPTPVAFNLNDRLLGCCAKAADIATDQQVAFLHMHAAMVNYFDSTNADIEQLMPDLIHFEQDGYLLIADKLDEWWQTIE